MESVEHEDDMEEFINYLEQNDIVDQITNVLIMLYSESERPSDPIEYVRKNMCPDNSDVREIAEMKSLIETAGVKLAELLRVRDELAAKLEQLENNEESFNEEEDGILQELDVKGNSEVL